MSEIALGDRRLAPPSRRSLDLRPHYWRLGAARARLAWGARLSNLLLACMLLSLLAVPMASTYRLLAIEHAYRSQLPFQVVHQPALVRLIQQAPCPDYATVIGRWPNQQPPDSYQGSGSTGKWLQGRARNWAESLSWPGAAYICEYGARAKFLWSHAQRGP
jgi:hypothetical protein